MLYVIWSCLRYKRETTSSIWVSVSSESPTQAITPAVLFGQLLLMTFLIRHNYSVSPWNNQVTCRRCEARGDYRNLSFLAASPLNQYGTHSVQADPEQAQVFVLRRGRPSQSRDLCASCVPLRRALWFAIPSVGSPSEEGPSGQWESQWNEKLPVLREFNSEELAKDLVCMFHARHFHLPFEPWLNLLNKKGKSVQAGAA